MAWLSGHLYDAAGDLRRVRCPQHYRGDKDKPQGFE